MSRREKMNMKKMAIIFSICLLMFAHITGCIDRVNETGVLFTPQNYRAEDWTGKSIGTVNGTVYDSIITELLPGTEPVFFNHLNDAIEAMKNGRVDAVMYNDLSFILYDAEMPGLRVLEPFVVTEEYGVVTAKGNRQLLDKLNEFIVLIHSDGTYEDMLSRWLDPEGSHSMPDIADGSGALLSFGTSGVVDGFTYFHNNEITGFDVEFAKRFAAFTDMKLDIYVIEFGGLIPAVQSGKIDFSASLYNITEERAEYIDFTIPYHIGGGVIAILDTSLVQSGQTDGFFASIIYGFERNLVNEGRWKMILEGLSVSMIITLLAFTLATLLGFGICGLRMSKNRILKAFGSVYVAILRGTPVVVLMMITFYVIFAKSSISAVTVAIIAFGVNGAAFIGEIIRSAILTIDKGQVEAARSMGFSKTGAFLMVTFPQAVKVAFPVYMSEFVSLFKMTSIVGYIAIVDLTKAGDIIRSRTYDAFYPLIIVALVYLIAASLMIWFFNEINHRTDKRLRRDRA